MSLLERLEKVKQQEREGKPIQAITEKRAEPAARNDPYGQLKIKIHKKMIEELGQKNQNEKAGDEELSARLSKSVSEAIDLEVTFIPRGDKDRIVQEIVAEAVGFGPIHALLNDESVSEVMVNGPNQVYVERKGKLVLTDVVFRDDDHVMHIIEKIVAPIGRRILEI